MTHTSALSIGTGSATQDERLLNIFQSVIDQLKPEGITFAGWLSFIFEPEQAKLGKDLRRKNFWHDPDSVKKLLNNWIHSRQTASGRILIVKWAKNHVVSEIRKEVRRVTKSGVLRLVAKGQRVGPEYLEEFRIQEIHDKLQKHCGTTVHMLLSIAGVDPPIVTLASAPSAARNVVTYSLAALLREHSQKNNLLQVVFGLYMYAAGLQRQAFSILSHIGILVSYSHLISGLGVSAQHKKKQQVQRMAEIEQDILVSNSQEPSLGPLKILSNECLNRLQHLASPESVEEIGFIFDNINLVQKVAEQVLGRIDMQMNGTCATVFKIHGAPPESIDQATAFNTFLTSPPLDRNDVLLSPTEQVLHRKLMIHNILRIIVQNGGAFFTQYKPLLESTQPTTSHILEVHKSSFYSMPAMEIEESSVDGVIDVMTEMYSILKIDTTAEKFQNTIHFVGGDQKSISHLRSAKNSRAGNDDVAHSFGNLVPLIGLFHTLMAAITGFLVIHLGDMSANIHNPSSLSYHNTILERKPFSLSSLPPVSVSRNLINVSVIARVLHCLTLTSGCASLDEYMHLLETLDANRNIQPSWDRLVSDATRLYDKYANAQTVQDLRVARKFKKPGETAGDMVYENALLFLRDALNIRELTRATKMGDPGSILLVMKVFALSFRGSGRAQYAFEALSLIHHVQKVWPAPLRDLAFKNWLLNPTGRADAWVPLDLVQEHANFWIKTVYNATGSNASWSWLATISPCTEALRNLVRDLNGSLGTYLGTKHTNPDISLDITKLIHSLEDHKVYQLTRGRTFENEDEPAIDAESVGLQKLLDGQTSGLREYNRLFKSTQETHRQPVASEMAAHTSLPRTPPAHASQMAIAEPQVDLEQVVMG
ncbi:hypothetical protein CTheo_8854 [Ceratobasidium theobromae]|uniref:DUF6589 domain-containing protein n=1 Tax=Ceratobasidium theobromae TaxID=1582974 RepID=A0A5N5Q7J6_9AGAM|nr:hypothetical protein CTheo_8854 [Ceratobasidium theobromae]